MIIETIREYKRANRPFRIHLSDGRAFEIPHGDFCSVGPTEKASAVTIYDRDGGERVVPIFAVTSLELESTSKS